MKYILLNFGKIYTNSVEQISHKVALDNYHDDNPIDQITNRFVE